MKRTDFHNLVLVTQNDLRNVEDYGVQGLKERLYSGMVGCDTSGANAVSYFGVVKEPSDLRFIGSNPMTNPQFTIGAGVSYTRFDPTSIANPQYNGGERIGIDNSLAVTISNTSVAKYYIYLVYVELQRNKQFDEGGSNSYFIDRQDGFLVVQMTQAQATTLDSFLGNPNGSVSVSNITAPYLESKFSNDAEITATFGTFTRPGGTLTIGSFTVNHYNSVFLGEIDVTNSSGPVYNFYHTLPGGDPLLGVMFRSEFSLVDQFHRTEVGRGTSSSTNPHGMIIQDLGNLDDLKELNSSGIIPKFTTSLECKVNGNTGNVVVTQLNSGEYLFLGGKRIKSITSTTIPVSTLTNGINYVYVQVTGSIQTQNSAPWNYYNGAILSTTDLTTIVGSYYILCSVYKTGGNAYAYNGDPRYSGVSSSNPVTDLRVFGTDGYDYIHNTVFESSGKENLLANGSMQIAENGKIKGWSTGTQAVLTSANNTPSSGSTALEVAGSSTDESLLFPFDAKVEHAFRLKLHSQGAALSYTATLKFYRGKDKNTDLVGHYDIDTTTAGGGVTLWTLRESEYLATTTINETDKPSFSANTSGRANIGWASIQIQNGSASKLFIDDVVIRPKIRSLDLTRGNKTIVKGHLDATTDLTTLESLVDGGDTTLHTHSSIFPVGSIVYFSATTAPTGFLELNGSSLSRATYPSLYAFASTSGNIVSEATWAANNNGAFSTGDLSTTFRIPDLRGEFIRSWDHSRGVDAGRTVGSNQADAFRSHFHYLNLSQDGPSGGGATSANHENPGDHSFYSENTGGSETRPRNVAYITCIKY